MIREICPNTPGRNKNSVDPKLKSEEKLRDIFVFKFLGTVETSVADVSKIIFFRQNCILDNIY